MKKAISLAALIMLGACATLEDGKELDIKEDKGYVTGSNLPNRDRTKSGVVQIKPEDVERGRQAGTAASAPKTGG